MSNDVKQNFEHRIDSLISQIQKLCKEDEYDEVISNLSKYLCILIAGYTEKVFVNQLLHFFENKNNPRLVRFLTLEFKRTTNLSIGKIEDILNKFDTSWVEKLRKSTDYEEYGDALQSIYDNRNKIAHGENSNVGVKSLEDCYHKIQEFFVLLNEVMRNK